MTSSERTVVVAETYPACEVLGPGVRFVIWTQGCPLNCRECVSPQWIPFEGGQPTPVSELAEQILRSHADGITFSGGEPFAQADALADLVARVREVRDISVMSYSGYTYEHLRAHGTSGQHRLLDALDILVDGPFIAGRHGNFRWRGSANQRVLLLSERHTAEADAGDHSAGLQLDVSATGVRWLGVPVQRGFRELFEDTFNLRPSTPDRTTAEPEALDSQVKSDHVSQPTTKDIS
jgi:anaerobic ribonucleoside-triphosphate reductase activating protein